MKVDLAVAGNNNMEDYIKNHQKFKSRFFALKDEDGKGVQHQIILIEEEESDGGAATIEEPIITTWSDPVENDKIGGHSWRGRLGEFKKRFKYIGFKK